MRRPRHSAFTLIETISVIVVLAILGSIAVSLVSAFARTYADAAVVSDLHSEMSLALDRLVRDIRSMPLDPDAGQSAADIRYASQTELRWDDTNHVRHVGSTVEISDDLATYHTLLTDVSSLTLQFYDEDNVALLAGAGDTLLEGAADTLRARRVSINISAARDGQSASIETKIFLRATMEGAGP